MRVYPVHVEGLPTGFFGAVLGCSGTALGTMAGNDVLVGVFGFIGIPSLCFLVLTSADLLYSTPYYERDAPVLPIPLRVQEGIGPLAIAGGLLWYIGQAGISVGTVLERPTVLADRPAVGVPLLLVDGRGPSDCQLITCDAYGKRIARLADQNRSITTS